MNEKPLHVKVAEALGYPPGIEPCDDAPDAWHFDVAMGSGSMFNPAFSPIWRDVFALGERCCCAHDRNMVPRYDTDWAATGPLIEKYWISARAIPTGEWTSAELIWEADEPYDRVAVTVGATPLVAICNLILALHAASKL